MKRIATIFFSAIFFCLMSTDVVAQITNRSLLVYLPESDDYKEVIKYKESIERLNVG